MSKVLVIGANGDVARSLSTASPSGTSRVEMITTGWKTLRQRQDAVTTASVLLLDLTDPDAPGLRSLHNLYHSQPQRPVLIAEGSVTRMTALARLLEEPNVDFTRATDADEILCRLNRLLQQNRKRNAQRHLGTPPLSLTYSTPPLAQKPLVASMHDPDHGRLDARRVADFFGIALAAVARVLNVSLSRLHKTPAAASAQAGLTLFERIAFALLTLAGSPGNARLWLNAPDPQLDNQTPLAVLLAGRGQSVAEMLEDMLFGQPS